jgi:hypothetical protein
MTEQPGHLMADTMLILEAFTEHHVTAALAMDRPRFGKSPKAIQEAAGRGQPAGMEFRVAAGQPAHVAMIRWRFVPQR